MKPTECDNPDCDNVVTPEPGFDSYVRVDAYDLTERKRWLCCSTECVGEVFG